MERPVDSLMASITKNHFKMGLMFFALAVVLLAMNVRYIKNVTAGPLAIDEKGLVAAGNAKIDRNYVVVKGDKVFETGIAWGKTKRGSDKIDKPSEWLEFLVVGEHVLPVKMDADDQAGLEYTGELKRLDYDRELPALIDDEVKDPEIRKMILPMVLDASTPYNSMFMILCIGVGGLALLGGWNVFQSKVLWNDPSNHPLGKAMAKYGNLDMIKNEINDDFTKCGLVAGSSQATVGEKWVLVPAAGKPALLKLDDVVWIYSTESSSTHNAIKSTKHGIRAWMNNTTPVDVAMKPDDANQLVGYVSQRAPWAYTGFDGKLMLRWAASPREVVQEVEQRKRNKSKA